MSDNSQGNFDQELLARLQDPTKRLELWQRMTTASPSPHVGCSLARYRRSLPLVGRLKVLGFNSHSNLAAFPQCGGRLYHHFSHLNTWTTTPMLPKAGLPYQEEEGWSTSKKMLLCFLSSRQLPMCSAMSPGI